jgi:uncharacterized damage-inducible protein DinB
MKKWFLLGAALCVTSGMAFAQDSNPLVKALVKHWQTSKEFTLAVADKMPDDQYTFKASPAEMSFGQMASHIADADNFYCSTALGAKPGEKGADLSKTGVAKHITEAYDGCIAGIEKLSDADLTKTAGKGPRQSTVFELLWGGFTHSAHHRAALEVYLRLKGIEPPKYQF